MDELGSFTLIGFSDFSLVCGIFLSGNLGSVLYILSRLLGHLCGVLARIDYY